ncbi:MAG: glycosyltransferase family 2 protein [Rikenellaceae bacterium]|nr:glycosyltransferase family 2 protein [Rikenellaceae bacterium]
MKISGFTIIRNAEIYDFPIIECILSALPLVDEFIVVAGNSIDNTDEMLKSIKSDKIKIINTVWDTKKYPKKGYVYANQTDIALHNCTGDWCLYLQSDEVLHENSINVIRRACEKFHDDKNIEGFLLKYIHFYGDYDHYIRSMHFAYQREVRIVRGKNPDIHSRQDAQSFRVIPDFDYKDYWQKKGTKKLNCVLLDAYIYHYGWVRDPMKMTPKKKEQDSFHEEIDEKKYESQYYDYGNLSLLPVFKGQHPEVMKDRVKSLSWQKYLRFEGERPDIGKTYGLKYRFLNFIENKLLRNGDRIGGLKNYILKSRFK